MIVQLEKRIIGSDWSAKKGELADLEKDLAARLIAAGHAREVAVQPDRETAIIKQPRTRKPDKPKSTPVKKE